MKPLRYLLPLFLISVSAISFAGDIQILCEPGLRIYLDDVFVGTSKAREDGLALVKVRPGKHLVRVEKDGFLPQSFEVEILDLPIEVKVGEFSPTPPPVAETEPAVAEVRQLVGSLVVTSAPQNCVVEIDGREETKDTPRLIVGGLPTGEHTITFSKQGYDPISAVIEVYPGAEITVRGDFKSGKVETVHQGKGSLRMTSTPRHCTVSFMGKVKAKYTSNLNMTQLPAGKHPITVSIPGREMSTTVMILNRTRTILEVNFVKGEEPFVMSYEPK